MMFRRGREGTDPTRDDEWRAFAGRLELQDASDQGERLRRWLDLGEGAVQPVYGLRREGQPSLYLFDQVRERSGPTGTARFVDSGVLLRWHGGRSRASFRAMARRGKALDAIEAGRTGSRRLDLAAGDPDPAFGRDVSVFTRDEEATRALLGPSVRTLLRRLLVERGGDTRLVVGDEHLLVTCGDRHGAPFALLEGVATDLMTLYVLLEPIPNDA